MTLSLPTQPTQAASKTQTPSGYRTKKWAGKYPRLFLLVTIIVYYGVWANSPRIIGRAKCPQEDFLVDAKTAKTISSRDGIADFELKHIMKSIRSHAVVGNGSIQWFGTMTDRNFSLLQLMGYEIAQTGPLYKISWDNNEYRISRHPRLVPKVVWEKFYDIFGTNRSKSINVGE